MNYLTFNDLIKIFGLEPHLDKILVFEELEMNLYKKLGQLSGGVRRFIEIVTLLYTKGLFVLLDEPFSYISPLLVEKLIPHIKAQSKQKGIIITDHQYETVFSVANGYHVLYNGKLDEIETIAELRYYGYINR